MQYMGRKFYLDENKRDFQLVGKWLNISRSMNVLHSGNEVRSLLKRRKSETAVFLFLDKGEGKIFTCNITRGAHPNGVHLSLVLYPFVVLQTQRDWRVMYSPIQTPSILVYNEDGRGPNVFAYVRFCFLILCSF